jgi:hypothetical protein
MKPSGFKNDSLTHVVFSLNIIFIIVLFISITNRDFPKVGDDYRIHVTRMLDTHLHHLINGPAIQWYTPSFGGGLPAHPNPLYVQYSLPQFLMYLIDPWPALLISTAIYALMGSIAFYLFLRETLNLSLMAAALGATFIVANGFYLEHLIAGHVGYQQFPLLGVMLFAAFTKKINPLQSGMVMGLILALIINQAGFYLIIIFGLSLLIFLPLLYLLCASIFEGSNYVRAFASAGVFAVLLSMSKISAIFSFMRFFPRELSDNYGLTYLQGLKGLAMQLIGYTTLAPMYLIRGWEVNNIPGVLQESTGAPYGIWETDISLSPGVLLLLAICLLPFSVRTIKGNIKPARGPVIALLLAFLGIWLTTDFTLAQGPLHEFAKTLPVLKSLHVNVRFASAFILPASLLAAYGFDFLTRQRPSQAVILFLVISALTTAAFIPYYFLNAQNHLRYFNLTSSMDTYNRIREGRRFLIQRISDISDQSVFTHNASNLGQTYEAIFGYDLEYFHPELQEGSVFREENGYYNMTNPAGYVFPEENGLQPFERFRTDQLEELRQFVNREQPDLKISTIQNISNILNLTALMGVFLYFFTHCGLFISGIFLKHRQRTASI